MPIYDICYRDQGGNISHKFSANCQSDERAKILARAMKLPTCKHLEVWSDKSLIYKQPQDVDVTVRSFAVPGGWSYSPKP